MDRKKIKFIAAYDGTDYSGFQRQEKQSTIQGVLEKQLSIVTGEEIDLYASGRTDKGVHAIGQVCHFYTLGTIPVEKLAYVLSGRLPRGILAHSFEEVDEDFDSRKSSHWKTYHYVIENVVRPDLFSRRFRTHIRHELNVVRMNEGAKYLIGTHDFTSFCSMKAVVSSKVRTIYQCDVVKVEDVITIRVTGSGFLYNMVRIIAGTLIDIGLGKKEPDDIPAILAGCNRSLAGTTRGPEGLCLMEVGYSPWKDS